MDWGNTAANIAMMIPDGRQGRSLRVSLVTHNSELSLLQDTLRSLDEAINLAFAARQLSSVHIVAVDNGSNREYQSALQKLFDACLPEKSNFSFEVRLNANNPGFGAAHNEAQHGAVEDYLLMLNPDVQLAPKLLECALQWFDANPTTAALNPRSMRSDDTPEYLCKRFPSALVLLARALHFRWLHRLLRKAMARYEYQDRDLEKVAVVELLSGACLMVRASAFSKVRGFDERYFLYFEDFDLSLRLRPHGELVYLPSAAIVHHGGNAAQKGRRHIKWFLASACRFYFSYGFSGGRHSS
ncbi:MAG: glycosyltransferase [Pseudomonadota bacterium]